MTQTLSPSPHASRRVFKVLLVDDHPIVRYGLAQLIEHEPGLTVCGEADAAGEALELVRLTNPDVAVLDLSLSDGNGLELIKQIRSLDSGTRMIVSSMHDEMLYAERALRAGAMGYVHKSEAIERLIDAIHQVLQGRTCLSPRMTDRVLHRVMRRDPEFVDSPIETLSDRELEVFEMIGQGQATRQIAQKLHVSPKTIETHREHIKSKLDLASNNELVRSAVHWVLESFNSVNPVGK